MKAPRFSSWFWPLVECLTSDNAAMAERFQALSREGLLDFGRQYDLARSFIHPLYREGLVFDYRDDWEGYGDVFAAWVVSRGHAFWDEVRRDPEAFQRAADEFGPVADDFMHRRPDFIASSVFRDRFGE